MNRYQKRLAALALIFLIIGTFLSISQIYAHQSSDKKEDDCRYSGNYQSGQLA